MNSKPLPSMNRVAKEESEAKEFWLQQWVGAVKAGQISDLQSLITHPRAEDWLWDKACDPWGVLDQFMKNQRGPQIYEWIVSDPVWLGMLVPRWGLNIHEWAEGLYRTCCGNGDVEGMKWLEGLQGKTNPYGEGERFKPIDYSIWKGDLFAACCRSGQWEAIEHFLKQYKQQSESSEIRDTVLFKGYGEMVRFGNIALIKKILLHPDLKSIHKGLSLFKWNHEPTRLWFEALRSRSCSPSEMMNCLVEISRTPGYYGRDQHWSAAQWNHWYQSSSSSPYKESLYNIVYEVARAHEERRMLQREIRKEKSLQENQEATPKPSVRL